VNKEYVCTLDNRTFLNKEDMLEYLSSRYLRTVDHSENITKVKETFLHAFPYAILSLSTTNELFDDLYLEYDSSSFEKNTIYGLFTSKEFQGSIPFAISSSYEGDYNADLMVFKYEKNAISMFQSLFHATAYFSQRALSLIQTYNDTVSDVMLDSINYQFHDYSPQFVLSFKKTNCGE